MTNHTHEPRGIPSSGRRLLVIANEAATSERLRSAVSANVGGERASRVLVVAPAVNGRLRHWCSDCEGARTAAVRRLQECIELLAEAGIDAEGMIGDANPVQAIEDALRIFPADGLIVALLPQDRSASRAADVAERARAQFELPTTRLAVDAA